MGPKNPPIQKKFLKKNIFGPYLDPLKMWLCSFYAFSNGYANTVEAGNDLYNTAVRLQLILFSKDIGAF